MDSSIFWTGKENATPEVQTGMLVAANRPRTQRLQAQPDAVEPNAAQSTRSSRSAQFARKYTAASRVTKVTQKQGEKQGEKVKRKQWI